MERTEPVAYGGVEGRVPQRGVTHGGDLFIEGCPPRNEIVDARRC